MKALTVVVEEFNASGGIRVLTAVANVAASSGVRVRVVCPDLSQEPHFPLDSSIEVLRLPSSGLLGRLRFAAALLRLRWREDHVMLTGSYRLLALLGVGDFLTAREPPVLLVQGLDRLSLIELAPTPWPAKQVNVWLYALSRRMRCERVFVSHYLQRVLGQSGVVIPNFVAPEFLDADSPRSASVKRSGTIRIGWVGTAAPNKGGELFIGVCRAVSSDPAWGPFEVEFSCATADDNLRRALSAQPVIVVSPTSDSEMRAFYCSCDVVLSLSVSEGFGLPVLEAMAAGCPVICTDSGGVTDFVQDGFTGLLVPDRSVSSIVAALRRMLLEPGLRQRLSQAGRQMAEGYSFDRFAEGYTNLFSRLGLLHGRNSPFTPSGR